MITACPGCGRRSDTLLCCHACWARVPSTIRDKLQQQTTRKAELPDITRAALVWLRAHPAT